MFIRYMRKGGRLSIPHKILERFNLGHGDKLRLKKQGSHIVMEQAYDGCVFCGSRNVKLHRGIPYCSICAISLNVQIDNKSRP